MVTKRLHKTPPQITRLYNRGVKSVIPLLHGKSPGYEGWQKISDADAQKKRDEEHAADLAAKPKAAAPKGYNKKGEPIQ